MSAQYPLLIKGLYSNQDGTNSSRILGPGTNVAWSNVITENRGDIVAIDAITTMPNFWSVPNTENTPLGNYSIFVGGMKVIANASLNDTLPIAKPRSYEYLRLKQKGGQTIQLEVANTSAMTFGTYVHLYHFNKFASRPIIEARQTSSLKQRTVTVQQTFIGGQRIQRGNSITVPTASGNIVAIEITCTQDQPTSVIADESTLSMYVDGNSILEEASTSLFLPVCGRPGLIFPILIRPGSTISIEADTDNSVNTETLTVDVKFYFDDDITGKREYATIS
jgi:hypothetical protein